MTRVLQISDTHLSASKPHFEPNWAHLRDFARAQKPDLVIHTGDVSVDGAGVEDDLRYGAGRLAELGLPTLVVPGNHDLGEAGHKHQPVDAGRIAAWRRHFGPESWARDVDGWRLIGFDTMMVGSGLAQEREQEAFLARAMAEADGRRIAWFTHRPLFIERPDEADTGYWSVKPEPRARLLDLAARHDVAIVATGHLHRSHDATTGGRRYIWGPSGGFLVGPSQAPPMPGEAKLGAALYEFDGAGARVTRLAVPGLTDYWIDDVIGEVYPPRPDV